MAVAISSPFRVLINAAAGAAGDTPGVGTFGFRGIGWNGIVTNDQGKSAQVIFGKHWTWAQTVAADGKFYQFGGDGGIGLTGGQTARFFRYNMRSSPPVLDLYYPQYGESNKPFPRGFDQVHALLRTTNNKLYMVGGFYDNQVQVQNRRTVNVTVPAGSSVVETFAFDSYNTQTWKGWELQAGGPSAGPTSASLPAGIITYGNSAFPGARQNFDQSVYPRIHQVNVLGNQPGHGDDHAVISFYLYNNSGASASVPTVTFTCSLAAPSNFTFSAQTAMLPATIPAGGWLWCELPVPSFNQDPARWYVAATATDAKVATIPTLPTGLTASVKTTKVNPNGYVPTVTQGVYTYGNVTAEMQVTLTNTTGSSISISGTEIYVSSGRIGVGDYPASEAGAPGKGGAWNYTMGSPGTWVKTLDTLDDPLRHFNQEVGSFAYDSDLDCGWWVFPPDHLYQVNLDSSGITRHSIDAGTKGVFLGQNFGNRLGQVYCSETREVFCLACPLASAQTPTKLVGVSTAAATRGQVREIASLPIFGHGNDLGGMIPLVLVPNRKLVIMFTPEQIDYTNSTGLYKFGPPLYRAEAGFPVKYGGIFLINYLSGVVTRYDYPTDTAIVDAAITDYGQVMVVNAGYDPMIDKVWGTVKNNRKILHWGWA